LPLMFRLGQPLRVDRLRIDALRQLYRQSLAENESEARSLRLLRHWLSPDQRSQFDDLGYFEVVGCDTGRRYRIYHGSATNVYEIDHAGCLNVGRCFMPVGNLVAGDVMLAQKIALETNECGALAVAKGFPLTRELRRPQLLVRRRRPSWRR
jgi:hypothetical protein